MDLEMQLNFAGPGSRDVVLEFFVDPKSFWTRTEGRGHSAQGEFGSSNESLETSTDVPAVRIFLFPSML